MPFLLKSAPITFQRMMINSLFAVMLGTGVYAYLDDMLFCGKDGETHLTNLEAVLLKLRDAGLKTKFAKCEFVKSKICSLGYKVDGYVIHTTNDEIFAINKFLWRNPVENVR